MRTEPLPYDGSPPAAHPSEMAPGVARRIGARLLHEAWEALPPWCAPACVASNSLCRLPSPIGPNITARTRAERRSDGLTNQTALLPYPPETPARSNAPYGTRNS